MNNTIRHLENGDFEVVSLEDEPFSWLTSERFSEAQRKQREDCMNGNCPACGDG
jgi:hypothetical protein